MSCAFPLPKEYAREETKKRLDAACTAPRRVNPLWIRYYL
ncbi:hypothetical protein BIFANG_02534 [Bifidobacterium angulatum DSM 20098 = JCM 7096]|uniref:Uncharacterized protein n=1 Tax=Bifidobacterium angulatum DSM 20098 = JCM 7096 TaxID=518635 RepID=C4FDZ6_9BIFI|nr:hypothetical protein BIFANG_02534 [Bifidobacterium angulatum DSM 20098 = JCM 7096]